MKRIFALLFACVMILSAGPAGAEGEETGTVPKVDSFDFDLKFHLNADVFPFRQRKQMQGYAELLEDLELKGNYSWCGETQCLDLHLQLIPVNDPDAALSFRLFGWLPNWLNVSSPLLGGNAVCFQPKEIMNFTVRAWEFFQIPLFPLAVLIPGQLEWPYRELAFEWEKEIATLGTDNNVLPPEMLSRITEGVRAQLENDLKVTALTAAIIKTLPGGELAKEEIHALPDLLIHSADGESLTRESDGENLRFVNHRGEILYEEHRGEHVYESALTLPPSGTDYTPAFRYRREDEENDYSLHLSASWDRTSDEKTLPDSFFRLEADLDHIPALILADTEFSGNVSVDGILLPNFSVVLKGLIGADGNVNISVGLPDKPEAGPVFSCSGTVVSVPYEGTLEYMIGEIITDFNLIALSDQSLTALMEGVLPGLMEEIPDFVYAMPTRGIQSILDTLEQYGLLQITLQ